VPKATLKKRKSVGLTSAQVEIASQFGDYSFENPKMTFEQVALKELGPKVFSRTPQVKKFKRECRKVFDREREACKPKPDVSVV